MPSKFARPLIVVVAAIALCVVGYRQMTTKPVLHEVTPAACTPEAIKSIVNITERAIQSSKCAQPAK
jgi:hypothetical protein